MLDEGVGSGLLDPEVGVAAATIGRRCRVLLADDHAMLLDMLSNLLEPEFEVVGAVTDGSALLEAALRLQPDIALVDINLPKLSGLDAGRHLAACAPAIKVVYLTAEEKEESAAEAFANGAFGYLLKTSPTAELVRAMRIAANCRRYLTPAIANGDVDALCRTYSANPVGRLSARELEVLKLVVSGLSMKSVARKLGIAPRTVAFHKYRAMGTLGLHGNSALIEFAVLHGLLRANAAPASSLSRS
jgi:DNA-binding NarL/FixJ family response regulator